MSSIVTGTTTGFTDDTSMLQGQADIRREIAVETCGVVDAVKTAGWHNSDRTGTEADRIVGQATAYFIAGQQNDFSNASALAALKAQTDMQFAATQYAIQLSAEKNAAATALASANTNMLVVQEAVKGRELQERNLIDNLRAELHCERDGRRHYHEQYNAGLFNLMQANTSAQINAIGSQIAHQTSVQKSVNFGNQSGGSGNLKNTSNVA